MKLKKLVRCAGAVALAAGLAACGGGGGGQNLTDAFARSYASALAGTDTAAGVDSTALKDSFDSRFLDAGMTKAQVVENLALDAQAMATADYSLFPQLKLVDASVTNCGTDGICSLNGNLSNSDADETSVPFSARVILSDGVFRLYGDQSKT